MMGVFAEFERATIQERVRAGLRRAKAEGKQPGRPRIAAELEKRILAALRALNRTEGVYKIAARAFDIRFVPKADIQQSARTKRKRQNIAHGAA